MSDWRLPLMFIVIVTTAKEEVGESSVKSEKCFASGDIGSFESCRQSTVFYVSGLFLMEGRQIQMSQQRGIIQRNLNL